MPDTVDHEARRVAERAETKIDGHEDKCAERWAEARKAMEGTATAIGRLHGRIDKLIWAVAVGAVGVLANILVPLIMNKGG